MAIRGGGRIRPNSWRGRMAAAEAPGRWHGRNVEVDWLAIRLTIGRGYSVMEASRIFDVGESRIYKRKDREKWSGFMLEEARRDMSAMIWLAGVTRLPPGDAQRREALKAASEWGLRVREKLQPWPEHWRETAAEAAPQTIEEEVPDDIYYSGQDPLRDERAALHDQLAAIIAGIEGRRRDADAGGRTEAGSAQAPQVADDAAGAEVAGCGEEGVACVGPAEPACS